jgi:hypothetical protein
VRDLENDDPFAPVLDKEEAHAFVLRLLGGGDEVRGKLITRATLAGYNLRHPAMEGKLRPSMIKNAIKSYVEQMTKLEPLALRALQIALNEKGTLAEASDPIPRNAFVVPIEHWRLCFCRIDGYKEPFRKRRFQEGSDYLIDQGTVLLWRDQAWLAESAHQSPRK